MGQRSLLCLRFANNDLATPGLAQPVRLAEDGGQRDTGICHHGALFSAQPKPAPAPARPSAHQPQPEGPQGGAEPGARLPHRSAVQNPWAQAGASQGTSPQGSGAAVSTLAQAVSVQGPPHATCLHLGSRGPWLPSRGAVRRDPAQHRPPHTADRGPRARLAPCGSAGGDLEVRRSRPTCAHLRPPSPTLPGQVGTGTTTPRACQAPPSTASACTGHGRQGLAAARNEL